MRDEEDNQLPPDPDGLNDDRAQWAKEALGSFSKGAGSEEDTAVSDLLTDLRHYCDRHGLDWEEQLFRANNHYAEETMSDIARQFLAATASKA
jgi:hypothetical protein